MKIRCRDFGKNKTEQWKRIYNEKNRLERERVDCKYFSYLRCNYGAANGKPLLFSHALWYYWRNKRSRDIHKAGTGIPNAFCGAYLCSW